MTDLRKAAEMALEVLEEVEQVYGSPSEWFEERLQALRQALAQPEQGNSSLNYHIAESNTPLDKIVEIAIQGHASTRDAIRWAMQQEREACAKVCDDICLKYSKADDYAERVASQWCAEAIRARSEKPPVKSYCGGKPNYCTPEVTPEVTTEVTGDVGACVTCGAPKGEWLVDAVNMSQERVDETAKREHEPVAWVNYNAATGEETINRDCHSELGSTPLYKTPPSVEAAVLAEREACAKVCDDRVDAEYATGKVDHNEMGWTQACAQAIRARGEK